MDASMVGLFLLPGFDHRFGWSRTFLGGVPPWLSVLALGLILGSWLLIFQVFRHNTFAAAVIQVETGQKVVSDGPYRIVRHPMYSAIVLIVLSVPLALGSYFALPLARAAGFPPPQRRARSSRRTVRLSRILPVHALPADPVRLVVREPLRNPGTVHLSAK